MIEKLNTEYFIEFNNFLPKQIFIESYEKLLKSSNWQFSGCSDVENKEAYVFWYHELINDDFYSKFFLKRVEQFCSQKFKVNRIYANGQTFGLSGLLHTDDDRENTYTFLYYLNPHWDISWGGSTVFQKNSEEFISYIPKPNTGILFKSNMLHVGMEPSRACKNLRITIALKLEIGND